MKPGRIAVLAFALSLVPLTAVAQHRFTTEALVGIDQIPFVVHDLDAAEELWRNLGFLVKPGKPRADGAEYVQVRFEDGSGFELVAAATAGDEQQPEGPMQFGLHARDLGVFGDALEGSPFKYGTVSRTFALPSLGFLNVTRDSRAPDDAAWLKHRNGATALSRVWLAASRRDARDLSRLFEALKAEMMGAKVYAPEAIQGTVATVSNGEVLILPEDRQLTEGRRVIGATVEVESLAALRRRLTDFGIPFATGGALDQSLIVAPEVTHGMWLEFRE